MVRTTRGPPAGTRRISVHLYLTLDGCDEFPTYPGSDHPFPNEPDRIAEEMWVKRWGSIDTLLFDRETFGQWADFWPLEKRTPEEHPWIRRMAEFAEKAQKVVLLAQPGPSDWANTRFLEGDLGSAIDRLRSERGGDLAVVAPSLGRELMRRGLVDEFYFAVFPVILGKVPRLFGRLESQQTLRLMEVKSFRYGELFLHYQAVR